MNNITNHIFRLAFISWVFLFLINCHKDTDVPVETITGNQGPGKELIIEVFENTGPGLNSYKPLSGVDIRLFDKEENYIIGMNEVKRQTTDSTGVSVFKAMTSGYFYLVAIHPSLGRLDDGVNLPAGAVRTYMEIVYY